MVEGDFEVWSVGEVREQDELLARFETLEDAARDLKRRVDAEPSLALELREAGVRTPRTQRFTSRARRSTLRVGKA